jgi:hypothetical protein
VNPSVGFTLGAAALVAVSPPLGKLLLGSVLRVG